MHHHSPPLVFASRLLIGCGLLVAVSTASAVESELFVSGLESPLFVTAPVGDSRVFVVEQPGYIQIYDPNGVHRSTFLDIAAIVGFGGEQGLLGLAFSPTYATDRKFYVNYTNNSGDTVIARYFASLADPDLANPMGQLVLTINQPFSNHNGGRIAFGPDGYLYIGMGDGGSGGDPLGSGQDINSLLGKILRVHVNGLAPYTIPADNPYVGIAGRDEIWAIGMRNPWGLMFDSQTGDLYCVDVGQESWEEVNVQPASSTGGENYGWNIMEGRHCYEPPSGCDQTGLVLPVHEYSHSQGCSITGGTAYRGAIASIQGHYFFADLCSSRIWSFVWDGAGGITDFRDRTAELAPGGGLAIESISGFGTDGQGELYIVDLAGEVFRVTEGAIDVPPVGDGPAISRAVPNPLLSTTRFDLGVTAGSPVRVRVLDAQGRVVRRLLDGAAPAQLSWDGLNDDGDAAAPGVYMVEIEHERGTSRSRVTVLR
jgi:glucose/arabinose dehydrogenase